MVYCIVQGCHNDSKYTKGVSYYRLMSQPPLTRSEWLEKLNMKKCVMVTNNSVVCSEHFEDYCFVRDLKSELLGCRPRRYLRKGSVPTIFKELPDEIDKVLTKKKRGRKKCNIKKKIKKEPISIENNIQNVENVKCDYCLLTSASNNQGVPEELLVCKDCNAKAHPSCMDYSPELAERSRMFPWQCIDCKTCSICEDPGNADSMLFCDACDRGFHMGCHSPAISEKPNGKWMCAYCARENGCVEYMENGIAKIKYEITKKLQSSIKIVNGINDLPSSKESTVPVTLKKEEKSILNGRIKDNFVTVRDTKNWSIDDVVKYFVNAGFPEESAAFKEQEIDGKSLLLLKRNDVLTGLSLKLGPALKIYNHVRKLQTGRFNGQT
ncbi:uncharacterized protein [Centruroides vittatus]|uniref:uncharacterized protein n=1 Tax=Centruroides vittatus TaxID=120091 RepID=UPI00350EB1FD